MPRRKTKQRRYNRDREIADRVCRLVARNSGASRGSGRRRPRKRRGGRRRGGGGKKYGGCHSACFAGPQAAKLCRGRFSDVPQIMGDLLMSTDDVKWPDAPFLPTPLGGPPVVRGIMRKQGTLTSDAGGNYAIQWSLGAETFQRVGIVGGLLDISWGQWLPAPQAADWDSQVSQERPVGGCVQLEYVGPHGASLKGVMHIVTTDGATAEFSNFEDVMSHPASKQMRIGADVVAPLPLINTEAREFELTPKSVPRTCDVVVTCCMGGLPVNTQIYAITYRAALEGVLKETTAGSSFVPETLPDSGGPKEEEDLIAWFDWANRAVQSAGALAASVSTTAAFLGIGRSRPLTAGRIMA